ncbi:hypothetical protein Mal64_39070 [Pseudobythopirellula maris]|uniref:Transmembrane protein n=1 Tax=Pseudobythopirellula maris TaxID=2527991 RepID=A0A5C5ZGI2_9BACT|nr:hypothetical protein [Pseudobythopirellula maris]TWT86167.1 hypothetical protein Mal64_39070 [Pseudobythopirellula maris]
MNKPADIGPAKPLGEPDAHVMMRRLRTFFRVALSFFFLATIVLLVFYRPAAYLAAIPVPVLGVVLLVVGYLEREARASALRSPEQEGISAKEVEIDVQDAGIATALELAGVMAMGAFAIAALVFDVATLGAGAAFCLLLGVWYGIPYWGLFVTEAMRDERNKARRHTGGAQAANACSQPEDPPAAGSFALDRVNEMTHWEDDGGGNVGADYEWLGLADRGQRGSPDSAGQTVPEGRATPFAPASPSGAATSTLGS